MKTIQTRYGMAQVWMFNSIDAAARCIARMDSPAKFCTVMGDAPQYWVTTRREAARLVAAGYEYAG